MVPKTKGRNEHLFALVALILVIILIGGCAAGKVETKPEGVPQEKPRERMEDFGFQAIRVGQGDTLSSLAKKYLGDATMDWFIAEFNGITAITPGQELIIPLKPYDKGGLSLRGYQTVPVLSYHQFSETVTNKMTVSRSAFEEQMKFLKDDGYHVITIDDLLDFLDFKKQVPKKSVVITIDDGWRSMYDIAFPILKQYGYPATLFVYTDLITGSYKTLSWDLIQKMAESGIDIQCHTKTHRDLTKPDANKKETFKEYLRR
jgi:biotin operon repressor